MHNLANKTTIQLIFLERKINSLKTEIIEYKKT